MAEEFDIVAAISAAEQGDAQAQTRLGLWYFDGQGGQPDYAQAAEWFSKAAEQGNAVAQCQLGNLYVTG
jgi:TPR repeat protein